MSGPDHTDAGASNDPFVEGDIREPDAPDVSSDDSSDDVAIAIELESTPDRRTTRRLHSLLGSAAVLTVALIATIAWLVSLSSSADDDRRAADVRTTQLEAALAERGDELRTAEERIAELETTLVASEDSSAAVAEAAAELRNELDDVRGELVDARRENRDARDAIADKTAELERQTEAADQADRALTRIETSFPIDLDSLGDVRPTGDFGIVAKQQSCNGWTNCEPSNWEDRFGEIAVRCEDRCTVYGLTDGDGDRLRFDAERGTWIANGDYGATCDGVPTDATWRIELRPVRLGLDGGDVVVDRLVGDMKYASRNSKCTDSDVLLTIGARRS